MKCPFVMKICKICGKLLVANVINFGKARKEKYGVKHLYKKCEREYKRQYREDNKNKLKEYSKQYYEENKSKILKHNKEYYESNKKEILEYHKKYSKQYYEENREEIIKQNKQYRKNNPDKYFNGMHKRRQLEENQGRGVTKEQWLEMMNFFEWKCAYSGENLDNNNRSIDHIIPLSKEGLNEVWNLVPMKGQYNSSKHTKDMVNWYKQQEFFDIDRLMKIYEWQEYAFEKWGLNNGKSN